jgi:hypothetical protein
VTPNRCSRRRLRAIAAAAVAGGAVSWAWGRAGWPARGLVRGHLGDVAAAALLYALVGLVTGAPRKTCAALAIALALAIEVAQCGAPTTISDARALTLGAHFDPWDLVAYAAGVALAAWAAFFGGAGDRPSPAGPPLTARDAQRERW